MNDGVLNYTGNKSKLIPKLNELFSKSKATRLVDCCAGGMSVSLNNNFDCVLANDSHQYLIKMYKHMLSYKTFDHLDFRIKSSIQSYGLGKTPDHKENYIKFREVFNKILEDNHDESMLFLLCLHYHSFSNMIRFSDEGFNVSFGARTYNPSCQKKLKNFFSVMRKKNIELSNKSFVDLDIKPTDLVYIDPPYLITHAVYNEGWDESSDLMMFDFIDDLNSRGIDFVMSNVFHHRGKTNQPLIDWSKNIKYTTKNIIMCLINITHSTKKTKRLKL